jgi:hypothetical protein
LRKERRANKKEKIEGMIMWVPEMREEEIVF